MYEGSMYGAGVAVFAVWGYVISHARYGRVELNPRKLADTLGGTVDEIAGAIKKLLEPDPESRHKEHDGRRLLREGEFQYNVPSWESYQGIKNEAGRREYNKIKQREYRAKIAGMTPEELALYKAERSKAYRKRKKELKHDAYVNGATQAITDGFAEHKEQWERECKTAEELSGEQTS